MPSKQAALGPISSHRKQTMKILHLQTPALFLLFLASTAFSSCWKRTGQLHRDRERSSSNYLPAVLFLRGMVTPQGDYYGCHLNSEISPMLIALLVHQWQLMKRALGGLRESISNRTVAFPVSQAEERQRPPPTKVNTLANRRHSHQRHSEMFLDIPSSGYSFKCVCTENVNYSGIEASAFTS